MSNIDITMRLNGATEVSQKLQESASKFSALGLSIKAASIGIAAAGAAAAAAIPAMLAGIKDIIDLGGKMNDLSAATNISTQKLLVYGQALADNGSSAENLAGVLSKVEKAIGDAGEKGGDAASAFERIGITVDDLMSQDPGTQFERVAGAIQAIQDPAQRTSAAFAVFGKGAADLLPLLANGGAFEEARASLGKYPDVLSRNVKLLDDVGDAIGRIPSKLRGFFAGFVDMINPELKALQDAINSIDLTELGQKAGGFVRLIVNAWNNGKLHELIGLTIEAGFELGRIGATKIWDSIKSILSSENTWKIIGNNIITSIAESLKAAVRIILMLTVPFAAVANYAEDAFGYAFQSAANGLASALEWVINDSAKWMNEKFGTSFEKVSFARETGFQKPDMGRSMELAKSGAEYGSEVVASAIDKVRDAARSLLNIAPSTPAGNSALDELMRRIEQMKAQREAESAAATNLTLTDANGLIADKTAALQWLTSKENSLRQAIADIQKSKDAVENNVFMTENEKWRIKSIQLQTERENLEQIVSVLREKANLTNEEDRKKLLGEATKFQGQLDKNGQDQSKMGADPQSVVQQLDLAITQINDRLGSTAQMIGRTFTSVIGSAIDGIAGGIEGLIRGTMTWSQALRNIGSSILSGVISAISKMFAEWIVKRLLMKSVEISSSLAEGTAKLFPATMTSISSYGVAAAVGVAAIVAAMAAFGGFADGGETPNRPTLAWVGERGTELVLPAHVTSMLNSTQRSALVQGNFAPMQGMSQGSDARQQRIVIVSDERRLKDMENDPGFENVIIRLAEKNRWRYES